MPVGPAIRLEVNHRPGLVQVHGLFSPRPLSFDTVRALVEPQRRALARGGALDWGAGLEPGVVVRVSVEIVAAEEQDDESRRGGE